MQTIDTFLTIHFFSSNAKNTSYPSGSGPYAKSHPSVHLPELPHTVHRHLCIFTETCVCKITISHSLSITVCHKTLNIIIDSPGVSKDVRFPRSVIFLHHVSLSQTKEHRCPVIPASGCASVQYGETTCHSTQQISFTQSPRVPDLQLKQVLT